MVQGINFKMDFDELFKKYEDRVKVDSIRDCWYNENGIELDLVIPSSMLEEYLHFRNINFPPIIGKDLADFWYDMDLTQKLRMEIGFEKIDEVEGFIHLTDRIDRDEMMILYKEVFKEE